MIQYAALKVGVTDTKVEFKRKDGEEEHIRDRCGQIYCYEVGDLVLVLHGYAKRTKRIPPTELQTALKVKAELLGGST